MSIIIIPLNDNVFLCVYYQWDILSCMCVLTPQEARLRETALYGLVEWIPQLVEQGVDIDAGDVVRSVC